MEGVDLGVFSPEANRLGMIFPGMDPYLEDDRFWKGVHTAFVVYLGDFLQPRLRPNYVAHIELRVYSEFACHSLLRNRAGIKGRSGPQAGTKGNEEADEPIRVRVFLEPTHESSIAILDLRAGRRVVTVIEVISPTNQYAGPGRESYLAKQREVLTSDVHLVEIDLLRQGPHVLAVPEHAARERANYDYLTCVNRAEGLREAFDLYPTRLRDRLPRVRIPLADEDPDVVLDVQAVLSRTYDAGSYREVIDYSRPSIPPLSQEDMEWAKGRLSDREI